MKMMMIYLFYCFQASSYTIGPTQPVVAMIGDDIILPCHLEPAVDAGELTVEWSRNDLKPRFVYLRRNGVELLTEQNLLYTKRTSLSVSKLQCGDISLKLSTVKLSDAGTYKCLNVLIPLETTPEKVLTILFFAGSVSSPVIELSTVKNVVLLECESNGWYPEPQLLWLNSEGKLISAEPTKTVRGSDGLYTVSSKVSVEKGHSYRFTCRVQQKNISQIKEAHIHVSGREMVYDLYSFTVTESRVQHIMSPYFYRRSLYGKPCHTSPA
uniref:Ig-like domain-containing protein n=1 Tax=Amphilophus citrinellus TaxID=61819 RepID=A0A3Q0RWK3_AMPCI